MTLTTPYRTMVLHTGFSMRQICPESGLEDFCRDVSVLLAIVV